MGLKRGDAFTEGTYREAGLLFEMAPFLRSSCPTASTWDFRWLLPREAWEESRKQSEGLLGHIFSPFADQQVQGRPALCRLTPPSMY